MAKRGFGELELLILKIIRKKEPVTVREVYNTLGSTGSYTTIMTVMSRMADKGDLLRIKNGKQYIYKLNHQNTPSSKTTLNRIVDKIFGGKPIALMSYLLTHEQDISENELDEIEKLIQKRRLEQKNG